jgi:hypothetical protein
MILMKFKLVLLQSMSRIDFLYSAIHMASANVRHGLDVSNAWSPPEVTGAESDRAHRK